MHREIKAIKSGNLSNEDLIHAFNKSSLTCNVRNFPEIPSHT